MMAKKYNLRMSWSLRGVALAIAMMWAVVPQLACYMSYRTLSAAEMECCKEMLDACGNPNMTHECCRVEPPPHDGIAVKIVRYDPPRVEIAETPLISSSVPSEAMRQQVTQGPPPPPHDPSTLSLILRV